MRVTDLPRVAAAARVNPRTSPASQPLRFMATGTDQGSRMYLMVHHSIAVHYYAPTLMGGALSDAFVWRLRQSDVYLSRTSGLTRE